MYHASPYRSLRANVSWPAVVRAVVGDEARARQAARAILWSEVTFFVARVARLPIGPLCEDDEARADIAVRVLQKLEANGNAHLREWLARQDAGRDQASFWTWIKTIARCTAIDFARTSRRNLARRNAPFEWARVACVDPYVLGEAIDGGARMAADDDELELRFAEPQRSLRDGEVESPVG
jgi:DNA-directed RNA polymerase specialized sigma24 family protein